MELAALAVLEGQLAGNIGRTVLDDGNRTRSYRAACAVDSYTIVARVERIGGAAHSSVERIYALDDILIGALVIEYEQIDIFGGIKHRALIETELGLGLGEHSLLFCGAVVHLDRYDLGSRLHVLNFAGIMAFDDRALGINYVDLERINIALDADSNGT